MRALVVLAVLAFLVGCSTTPEPGRNTRAAAEDAKKGQRVRITPVVGASVEDARRPGVMHCAKCGAPTDERGACRCNALGMPGFGIEPTGRVKRSTSPR